MFLRSFVTGPIQANCYLLAPQEGGECVIIDPGMEAAPTVYALVTDHGLTPAGVLATHGHVDHVADAAEVADHYGVPVYIHTEDQILLTQPEKGVSADLAVWLAMILPQGLTAPSRVETLGDSLSLAGLDFGVIHAPGHTAGSVIYTVNLAMANLAFSGDVLFAGAIGRTDMPGGDPQAMIETLRGPVLALDDGVRILPGHGPDSTMATERAQNPYLQPRFLSRS